MENISINSKDILDIEFDEKRVSKEHESTTFYFSAPRNILGKRWPEADYAEISVEVPNNNMEASAASVVVGPVSKEEEGTWIYDWIDAVMPYSDIEYLLDIAK